MMRVSRRRDVFSPGTAAASRRKPPARARRETMPDERQDSVRQGIGAPQESPIGKRAEKERRRRAAEGTEIGGGIGGTSDAESAGDAARAREAERKER